MKYFWMGFWVFAMLLILIGGVVAGADAIQSAIDYTGRIMSVLAWALVSFAIGTLTLAFWFGFAFVQTWRRGQDLKQRRPRDGAFALQKMRLNNGEMMFFDPNQMASAVAIINTKTGHVADVEPGMGWHLWQPLRVAIQQTRLVQAMYPGDDVRDERSKAPSVSAAALRAMTQNKPPRIEVIDGHVEPMSQLPAPQPMGLTEAMRNNTPRTFALGTTDAGHVVRWQSQHNPHLRIHGLTQGSGKTNLLKIIAAGALNKGAHVAVLDRRRGKDWKAFDGRIELIDTSDPSRFATSVMNAYAEFEKRDKELAAAGAPNIDALGNYKRIVMIVAEFGVTWTDASAEGLLSDIEKPLVDMMRMSGASGVHWCFEDQIPDKGVWPRAITANTVPVAGRGEAMYGSLVGYHKAHELQPYHFHFGGQVFKTWDMTTPEAQRFVAGSPALNGYRVAVRKPVHDTPFVDRSPVVAPPPVIVTNGTNGAVDTSPKWQQFTDDWFAINATYITEPHGGISALARAMADYEGADSHEQYKSTAKKYFDAFRADVHSWMKQTTKD